MSKGKKLFARTLIEFVDCHDLIVINKLLVSNQTQSFPDLSIVSISGGKKPKSAIQFV